MEDVAVKISWRRKEFFLINFGIYEKLEDYVEGELSYAMIDEDGAIVRNHAIVGNVMELGIQEIFPCPEMSESGYKKVLTDITRITSGY